MGQRYAGAGGARRRGASCRPLPAGRRMSAPPETVACAQLQAAFAAQLRLQRTPTRPRYCLRPAIGGAAAHRRGGRVSACTATTPAISSGRRSNARTASCGMRVGDEYFSQLAHDYRADASFHARRPALGRRSVPSVAGEPTRSARSTSGSPELARLEWACESAWAAADAAPLVARRSWPNPRRSTRRPAL